MSLRGKLLVAQLPLALALVVVGAISLQATRALGSSSAAILAANYRSVVAAQRMNEAVTELEGATTTIVLGEREAGVAATEGPRRRFEEELGRQEANITEPGELERTRTLRADWGAYQQLLDRLSQPGDPAAVRGLVIDAVQPAAERVREGAQAILALNQAAMVHKSELAHDAAQRVQWLVVLGTLVALIAGGLVSASLTAQLLRPLSELSQAARRIGEGDLEARARVSGGDEVAQLATEFNLMAAHLKKYRETTLGELLQAQGAAQAAIDSLPDAVVAFDRSGKVVAANQVAERQLQLSPDGGDAALAEVSPEVRAVLERLRTHVLATHAPYLPRGYEEALRVEGQDGERWLLPRAAPVLGDRGGVSGATVVLQDVSRLRRFDELKNDLVATVAHEFRTPLTSLRMAIHLALEGAAGPLTEQQVELLRASRQDCERLQGIVDDLLDLSRVQAGQVVLEKRPVKVSELLERARDALASAAAEKQVRVEVEDLAPGRELEVDADRLGLAFSNLLSNALRYSPSGEVVVLRARGERASVRFEVVDRGPGVPAQYRERIFEKYFRVPGAPSGSAGLGLHIAREVVTAHGGEIGLEPADGKGSTFWFTVPAPAGVA